MAAGDDFTIKIIGRFESDLARWVGLVTERVQQVWAAGDPESEIVREQLIGIQQDIQTRMDLGVDSAAWQGYQVGKIDAIQSAGRLFNWNLDPGAHHCDDCPRLAAGGPYRFEDLPGVPGDAPTACNGGCRCYLTAA